MEKKDLETQVSILINLYNSKRFKETVQKGKVLIKKYPNQPIFYNATALALSSLGNAEEALDILKQALYLNNKDINVLNNLGLINSNINKNKESRDYLEKAISINKNFIDALLNLGNLDLKEGKVNEAERNLNNALKLSTTTDTEATINMALGNLNQQLGKFDEAMNNYKIINKISPQNTSVDKSISTMHKYLNENDPHLTSMLQKLEKIKDKENLKSLYFALGKAYEDIKNYKKSFNFLKLGNDIADQKIMYNIEDDKNLFQKIKIIFKKLNIDKIKDSEKTILFILGMPRSGTTLVEQIISSHNEVYGAGELTFIEESIKKLINHKSNSGEKIWENLERIESLDAIKLEITQSEYIEKLKSYNFEEKFITDKAPLNFKWIGFIKLIFPNSKIIHCNRNGMDTCYSNFKNSFSGNSLGFCYNLEKLGKFFNLYKDLMVFWNSEFKDQIHNISYENLINDKENEVKKLLKFCGLGWDENCLNPHMNKKIVATASLAQVRTPVYKSSINKWKNLEDELSELKKMIQ